MDGRADGGREGERRRLESCELVTFVIEFSHPAFSMLPPSFLSLPCFRLSLRSPLFATLVPPSLSLSLSLSSLSRSLITVSRDFSSFCLTDRTPELPSPHCHPFVPPPPRSVLADHRLHFEFLLLSRMISPKQKSVRKIKPQRKTERERERERESAPVRVFSSNETQLGLRDIRGLRRKFRCFKLCAILR